MEQLTFKVEGFEGPLELLLHLISKHKLDIEDIEISSLLTQYLDYLAQMKVADLEITGEFLTMAAHLVYIKTVSLLPVQKEEGENLRHELSETLLEYQQCRFLADKLREKSLYGQIFTRTPLSLPVDRSYRLIHPAAELLNAYLLAAGKAKRKLPPPKAAFSGILHRKLISVESRIVYVLKRLYRDEKVPYDDFFASGDRGETVATFLAMLELIKAGRVRVSDDNTFVYFAGVKTAS